VLTTNQDQIQLAILYSTPSALTSEIICKNPANPLLTTRSWRWQVAPSADSCTKPCGRAMPAVQEVGLGGGFSDYHEFSGGLFNFLAHGRFKGAIPARRAHKKG
jgi:hypothetical protein